MGYDFLTPIISNFKVTIIDYIKNIFIMKILNFLISQKPANLHIKINGKSFL